MQALIFTIVAIILGLCIWIVALKMAERQREQWHRMVDRTGQVEWCLWKHIRQHVIREKDFSWAEGLAPIATFGIKEDFTLLTDEEWAEALENAEHTDSDN